jgi:hypothetical protein
MNFRNPGKNSEDRVGVADIENKKHDSSGASARQVLDSRAARLKPCPFYDQS